MLAQGGEHLRRRPGTRSRAASVSFLDRPHPSGTFSWTSGEVVPAAIGLGPCPGRTVAEVSPDEVAGNGDGDMSGLPGVSRCGVTPYHLRALPPRPLSRTQPEGKRNSGRVFHPRADVHVVALHSTRRGGPPTRRAASTVMVGCGWTTTAEKEKAGVVTDAGLSVTATDALFLHAISHATRTPRSFRPEALPSAPSRRGRASDPGRTRRPRPTLPPRRCTARRRSRSWKAAR